MSNKATQLLGTAIITITLNCNKDAILGKDEYVQIYQVDLEAIGMDSTS